MNIAILGAAFDPPHIGHYFMTLTVLEKLGLDAVWLMPVGKHPFRKHLSSIRHRLTMAQSLENSSVHVSDFEIKQRRISYSYDTLETLSVQKTHARFRWIMGSDQLPSITKWKEWRSLFGKYRPIIYPRSGSYGELSYQLTIATELRKQYKGTTVLDPHEVLMTNVSSTIVRTRVRNNLSITHLVPITVERYIAKTKLYR